MYTPSGAATVICKTTQDMEGSAELCKIEECVLTPEHPIRVKGKWEKPMSISNIEKIQTDFV